MGEERERGTKDIAKPGYSTCNIIDGPQCSLECFSEEDLSEMMGDLITVVFSVWDAFQR